MKKTLFLVLIGLFLSSVPALSQDSPVATQTPSDTVAAIVNGEEISIATLNSASEMSKIFQVLLSELPQAFAQSLFSTPEGAAFLDRYQRDVLDRIIDSRIMIQQANSLGVSVEESVLSEKVQSHLDQIMQQNQMTMEEIDAALKQQGSSLDEYKAQLEKSLREQLMVQALQKSVVSDVTVSDDEVEEYYNTHQEEYTNEDGTVVPLADVASEIRNSLLNTAESHRWNAWFEEARASSKINILF